MCAALALLAPALAQVTPGPDQFRQDLQVVEYQLPWLHADFFRVVSEEDWYAAAGQLEANLDSLTVQQFYTRLAGLVAMAHDGHTVLLLQYAAPWFRSLPIRFRRLSDGVYATAAPAGRPELNGARLLRIGTLDINEVLRRLAGVISADNEYYTRYVTEAYLSLDGVLRGIEVAPLEGPVTYGLKLTSGEEVDVDVTTADGPAIQAVRAEEGFVPAVLRPRPDYYWYEYRPESRTLYFRYAQCMEMNSRRFAPFAAEMLDLLDRDMVDTLIVDVRQNTGGGDIVWMPFYKGLSDRVRMLRERNSAFRIAVVGDEGTASSGMSAVIWLIIPNPGEILQMSPPFNPIGATFIGQPTGGKPCFFGQVQSVTLPGLNFPLRYSSRSMGCTPFLTGRDAMTPDVSVRPSSADYFARYDPVFAAALAGARPPAADETGPALTAGDLHSAKGGTLTFPGTGLAAVDAVWICEQPSAILSASETELQIQVPGALACNGRAPVFARAGGLLSNGITITIE